VFLELLFPGRCLLCGGQLAFHAERGEPLCLECRAGIRPLVGSRRCRVCSLPLISEEEICTRCRRREYEFDSHLSLFEYQGAVRELIYQYKFRNRLRLARFLAGQLARVLVEAYPGAVLVPAPANPQAVRRRGWDPVERLCRALSRDYGWPACRALERRPGPAQKLLGYEARRGNLRGTIRVCRPPPARVVLLDDVFTTGATASECSRALKEAGAARVDALSLAIDLP
jgi:ComF family protein